MIIEIRRIFPFVAQYFTNNYMQLECGDILKVK
jgi:hypothetical protein